MAYLLRQQNTSRCVNRKLWFAAVCFGAWSTSLSSTSAQQVRPRFPLTAAQIVSEMQIRQLPINGAQVRLAVPIMARIADPPLDIQDVALLTPHEIRLRVTCRDRSDCLPFFATATYPGDVAQASIQIKPAVRTTSGASPVAATGMITETHPAPVSVRQASSTEPPMLRSGSLATLDLDEDRVHIRMEVVCLEGGSAGDKVRVASRDHKQFYSAQIVSPTLLKGTF